MGEPRTTNRLTIAVALTGKLEGRFCRTLGGDECIEPSVWLVHELVSERGHLIGENFLVGAFEQARKIFWTVVSLHEGCKVSHRGHGAITARECPYPDGRHDSGPVDGVVSELLPRRHVAT